MARRTALDDFMTVTVQKPEPNARAVEFVEINMVTPINGQMAYDHSVIMVRRGASYISPDWQ